MATPTEIINDARNYVSTISSSAESALIAARNNADASGGISIAAMPSSFVIKGVTKLPTPDEVGGAPEYDPVVLTLPGSPADMRSLDTLPAFAPEEAPQFTGGDAPVFVKPSIPSSLRDFGVTPPTVSTDFVFPDPPALLAHPILTPVVFDTHTAPDRPVIDTPEGPGLLPVNDAVQPTNLSSTFSTNFTGQRSVLNTLTSAYVDELIAKYAPNHTAGLAAVEARLQVYLDGGTGLKPEVEDAIYSRGRAKNDVEAKRVQDAAFADNAARGFTIPNGALMSALARARQEAANNNNKTNNEIMVAQAELEQKNLHFAVTTSASLRTTVLQLTNSWMQGVIAINGQALDAAKAIMGAVIEAYNTAVKVYMAKLDAWKAEVSMFEARIKVVLADIELYKADISALLAEYSVDQMKVDRLKAEISQLGALADMYKSQISAVTTKAELERLKVELFKTQAQGYTSEVQAKQAEWQGFSAQVSGYAAEAQAYSSRVGAYSSEVQAYKGKIDGKVSEIQAVSAKNQAAIDEYKARVSGFTALVQAESTRSSAEVENNRQKNLNYKAKIDLATAKYSMNLSYYSHESQRILEEARETYGTNAKKAELFLELAKLTGGISKEIGTIQGQMAASALAGMNSLAASTETI